MWHYKQLILAAARKSLAKSTARAIPRSTRSAARCSSSINADIHHEVDDEDVIDVFTKKQEALQKILKASSNKGQPENRSVTPDEDGKLQTQDDKHGSPSKLTYTGDAIMPVTSDLHIVNPQEDTPRGVWPVFRIMVGNMLFVKCLQVRKASCSGVNLIQYCLTS